MMATNDKITILSIQARKQGPKITMVTAYDTPTARIVDQAGVDMILVGDSMGTAILGFDTTLPVTMDMILHHTAAVTRAQTRALVVADLPWLSYHISIEETVRNSGRLIKDGRAEAVKLEGGRKRIPMIKALLDAEIPVVGHLGLTPQSFHSMGGNRVQGKSLDDARQLIDDAQALAEAGIFCLVLEGIPDKVAEIITNSVQIPTIGIGAGPHCDGQVLVFHDLLGFDLNAHQPKFVRHYARIGEIATEAIRHYCEDVQQGTFPADQETYHIRPQVAEALEDTSLQQSKP